MREEHERRFDERTECDIEAKVELSDRLAIACRIKDLSATTLRMQIADAIYLPDEFDLLVPAVEGTYQRYRVKMIWRNAEMVGGELVTRPIDD